MAFAWVTCGALVALVSAFWSQGAAAQALRMGGTGAASELMRHLGQAFAAEHGDATVQIVPGMGSSGGIRAVGQGAIDIAVSARSLKKKEAAGGLTERHFSDTPFVLATSHKSPNGLRAAELPTLFSTPKPTWADGAPLRVILRPRSESDTALLGKLFPGLGAAMEAARQRHDIPVAATDQDNAEIAQSIPGSLIGIAYTQLLLEERNLRPVKLDGVAPTIENVENGSYRYRKAFFLVYREQGSPQVSDFLAFLKSSEGAKAARQAGVIPVR